MTTEVLRAIGLAAGYGGRDVVTDIDLQLAPGTAPMGLVGPSGAGKSTILAALRGRVRPTAGRATWGERTVGKLDRRTRRAFDVAVRAVDQEALPGVDPRWTADRLVCEAFDQARRAGRPAAGSPIEVLDAVGLGVRFAVRSIGSLSGGERQRLALAHAIAARPRILLLDEPATAVDPGARAGVLRLLEAVAADGTAILLASHDLEFVGRLCPQVQVVVDGAIVAGGPLPRVLAESEHPAVRELAAAAPLAVQRFR